MRSRLILFAIYSKEGKINKNTLNYIKQVKDYTEEKNNKGEDYQELVLLVNHCMIDSKDLIRLQSYWKVVFVENYWYDFWMYCSFFQTHIQSKHWKWKLLLINDSVLVVRPLNNIFKWLDNCEEEYVGINEWWIKKKNIDNYIKFIRKDRNWYRSPYKNWKHIESWFIQIQWKARDLIDKMIIEWVPSIKEQTIYEYELKRSQIAYKKYTTNVLNKNNRRISICYDEPLYMYNNNQPRIKKNFNNYWYKKQFKPVIDKLATEIYKQTFKS